MELHGKQIFSLLEKPLHFAENFGLKLQGSFFRQPVGQSRDGHFKPSPKDHSSITSNPLIPAFLVLTFGFLLLTSSPVTAWLTSSNDLPTLSKIFSFGRKAKPYTLPKAGEGVSVWTMQQSGFYYCEGGTLFGEKPGVMMAQADALMTGYRPADGKYCQSAEPVVASSDNPIAPSQQLPGASDPSSNSEVTASIGNDNVSVWAMKDVGLYYCRGDVLFGSKPGKLMSQSEALSAGYLASVGTCTPGQPDQSSAANPSIAYQPPPSKANAAMPTEHPVAMASADSPGVAAPAPSVRVWVKTDFGFYYCKNDVLFGNKPGQLMTQSDALAAGYQPSDGACANGKTTRTSAEMLPSRGFPGAK